MGWLTTIYILTVFFTGIPAIFKLGLALGLCGTISPWVALGGGGGIAEALRGTAGENPAIIAVIGIALIGISLWWPYHLGWHLFLFGHDIPGWVENLVGAVLGFTFGLNKRLNPPI